jgi:hypothetical protein
MYKMPLGSISIVTVRKTNHKRLASANNAPNPNEVRESESPKSDFAESEVRSPKSEVPRRHQSQVTFHYFYPHYIMHVHMPLSSGV